MDTTKTRVSIPHKAAKRGKCVICGSPVAPFSTEDLCWICRRLKISAWRESESQPSAQD